MVAARHITFFQAASMCHEGQSACMRLDKVAFLSGIPEVLAFPEHICYARNPVKPKLLPTFVEASLRVCVEAEITVITQIRNCGESRKSILGHSQALHV